MSMAFIGIGGVVLGAGATAYGAHQQSKSKKEQAAAIGKADLGRRPEAAMYEPVDFTNEQLNAIFQNQNSLDAIKHLMDRTNPYITADAIRRADKLIPGYSGSMRQLGTAANDLISGRLPADAIDKLIADRAGSSNAVNIPGLAGPATLKDLGLSSLDAINQGTGLLGKMVSMAETVSPRASYMNPQGSMISPSDRIRLAMEQNALIQQSQQSANNIEAGADPGDAARLGMTLGLGNTGMDWGRVGQSVSSGLLGMASIYGGQNGGVGAGGYDPKTGYYKSPAPTV